MLTRGSLRPSGYLSVLQPRVSMAEEVEFNMPTRPSTGVWTWHPARVRTCGHGTRPSAPGVSWFS